MEPEILAPPPSERPADVHGRPTLAVHPVSRLSSDPRPLTAARREYVLPGEAAGRDSDAHSATNGSGFHAFTATGPVATNLHEEAWSPRLHVPGAVIPHPLPHVAPVERGFYLRHGKRILDVFGALAAMVLLAPVMAVVALAIKLESRGPVFYRSTRIGRNGRAFTFLKLRSMYDGADRERHQLQHLNECDGPTFKISRDPRVTRIGRVLRVTSLDEIPQFLNVLGGDMSLVGPRPPIPEEVEQYEPWQWRRLDVKPGITCLWQISGRSTLSFKEWMRLDLEYIKHRSFWLDLRILLRTIPAVLSREGAY
jgi:lipopolysaccharide/colanic/teichoic acid biosynthesis glycosyltransferase